MPIGDSERPTLPALRVRQWLDDWNEIPFDSAKRRAEPSHEFLVFSIRAAQLKALSGIQRRSTEGGVPREQDIGIQRQHDKTRSAEIARFVRSGYPWSTISAQQREQEEFRPLKKPGWLPTAIVVNLLRPEDDRNGHAVDVADAIGVDEVDDSFARLVLPEHFEVGWQPKQLPPIEVIDGQHRLWAFDDANDEGYELPVVAFQGLDVSWQAYLFWTINIKPKKINRSLAFDLYPLLRTEDWLQHVEGPLVYRETRAQELTELLWALPESPWYRRINMLGERGIRTVTQAAWIRALLTSYLRITVSKGIGGLFAASVPPDNAPLQWSRAQQAALLTHAWMSLRDAVLASKAEWALVLRNEAADRAHREEQLVAPEFDAAFAGRFTLLNGDQGVTAFLSITNDLIYMAAPDLELQDWVSDEVSAELGLDQVRLALSEIRELPVGAFIAKIAEAMGQFDWRTSAAPNLTEDQENLKASYRGTGGYARLRREILRSLGANADEAMRTLVGKVRLATEAESA